MSSSVLAVAVLTVVKVLLIACSGIAISRCLQGGTASLRGLGFVVLYVCLPCMLFTRIVTDLTWKLLEEAYIVVLFSMFSNLLGFVVALAMRPFVPWDLRPVLVLAATFQNAVSFPLAILASIDGIPWLTDKERTIAQTYVFIFNIWSAGALWTGATYIIRQGAAAEAANAAAMDKATSIKTTQPSEAAVAPDSSSLWERIQGFYRNNIQPLLSPPLKATLWGVLIALIPVLQWLCVHPPISVLLGGAASIGEGNVPLTLLLLGCNLLPPSGSPDKVRHVPVVMYVVVCIVRFVISPAVVVGVLHYFAASRTLQLVVIIEAMSPSAINISVQCTLHKYKAIEYTKVIFVEYVFSILSTTVWLSVALWLIA